MIFIFALTNLTLRGGVFRGNFAGQPETNRRFTRFAPIQYEAEGQSVEAMVEERDGIISARRSNPQSRWLQAALCRIIGEL